MRASVALLLFLLVASACTVPEEVDVSESSIPTTTTVTPTSTVVTTTTVARSTTTKPPSPPTLTGLPVYPEPNVVVVAQRLLGSLGTPVTVDGAWGPRTEAAWFDLRADFGLDEGGLDEEMWKAILMAEGEWPLEEKTGDFKNILVPETAVFIADDVAGGLGISESARYVLPHQADPAKIRTWYQTRYFKEDIGSWNWCEALSPADTPGYSQYFWWSGDSRMLSIEIYDRLNGRVDILMAVENGVALDGCDGYGSPPTTTQRPTATTRAPAPAPAPATPSSDEVYCYAGMNLETCEDLVGLSAGDRLPTIDCSGSGRGVWWAANWWILYFQGGYPVISKSSLWCE